MLVISNVSKIYKAKVAEKPTTALDNVSFKIGKPEFVSIVGRSGAGKTTLLRMILGEEKPTQGRIFFENQDVHKIKKSKIPFLRRRIGIVFQDYKLFSSKTTYENVAYVMEVIGAQDDIIKKDVMNVLEIVGLKDRADNFPLELSGGERQRVSIARALVHRPDIILADEPTGNLDPYNTFEIIRLLVKIYEMGTTVVLSTHDKEVINILKRRVITLEDGKVIRDEERGRFII